MVPPHVATLLSRLDPALVQPPRQDAFELFVSIGIEFVSSAIILAILGAIVLWVAPDFTADGVEYLHEEPVEAFLYGLIAFVVTVVGTLLLAVTVIGLLVVIPGLIVLAILGIGATTVSVISFGSWLRAAFGGGATTEYGTALVVGAIVWAAAELVPVVGGLIVFVVSTMGYGYLALWLFNGQFGRDYGSFDGSGGDRTGHEAADRYGPERGRDDIDERSVGGNEPPRGGDDAADRFRNIAALDAEREDSNDDASGRDEDSERDR